VSLGLPPQSPEIIGVMQVYKSPEARIDEGSIGGTVIINTRRPLELPTNTLRGSLGYNYNDRSAVGNPRASALYSWKNDADDFGILLAASHDKQTLSQAGVEFFGYTTGAGIPSTATVSGSGDVSTARMPVAIDSDYFQQTRQRNGLQVAAQWKPDARNEVNLTGIAVKGIYNNYSEARYVCPGCGDASKITAVTINNGLITGATVSDASGQPYAELDANYRRTSVTTKSLNLRHDYKGDDWTVATQLGSTAATGGKDPEYLMKFLLLSGGYSFSYGPKSAGVVYDNGSAANWGLAANSSTIPGDTSISGNYQAGGIYYSVTRDKENYGQIDFTHDLDLGIVNKLQFGVKVLGHGNSDTARGNRINTTDAITLSEFSTGTAPSHLYDGLDVSGDIKNWATADLGKVITYLNGQPQGAFNTDYASTFSVKERTKDLYTQLDYEQGPLRGNFGVRYVNTGDDATYFLSTDGGSSYDQTTTHTSYGKFLPSFNAIYDFDKTKTLRFSVAKVIARPRYSDLAGATSVDTQTLTGSGGNPHLKPYESTNFDLAGEWYFGRQSMVGFEAFFRDVNSYIVNVAGDQVINGQTYSISSPVNATSAKVTGLSLLYQQDLLYGFGVQTNFTYATANSNGGLNMPYLSHDTVNVIPYFENGPFSARVVYSWRSQYFTQVGRLNSQDFTDQYKELDLSASYQFTKNLGVTASATNLLDETYYQYSGTHDAPTAFYKNGRTLMVGLSYKL